MENNNTSSRPESGNHFHQDFSNKLRLELSPTVSDINLVSNSTQSSIEDSETSHKKASEGEIRAPRVRAEGLFLAPDTLDLSDTGASLGFKMDSSSSRRISTNGNPSLHSLHSSEDEDSRMSCQLNLTLASSPLQINNHHHYSPQIPPLSQNFRKTTPESDTQVSLPKNSSAGQGRALFSSREVAVNPEPVAPPPKANDGFWEQFLTERPGCSENEEASSNYRTNAYDDQGISRNAKHGEQLRLL